MANDNLSNNQPANAIITLGDEDPKKTDNEVKLKVVEETLLTVKLEELLSKPETKLAKMITITSGKPNEVEIYNVKPQIIDGILDYYRRGFITIPENVNFEEMKQVCDKLEIPFSLKTVQDWKTFLRIQADNKRKQLVHKLIDERILPHLIKLSENGRTFCCVTLAPKSIFDSKPNDGDTNGDTTDIIYCIDAELHYILINDDQESSYIVNYLNTKGFKSDIIEDEEEGCIAVEITW